MTDLGILPLVIAAAAGTFHEAEGLAFYQGRGAAEHGVGAFHGFDRYAGSFGDGHALTDVVHGEGRG